MLLSGSEDQWFALQVRTRMEPQVSTILRAKGYEEFLPTYTVKSRPFAPQALFPGYLFCRITPQACGLLVTTPGVIRVVQFGGKPAPIDPDEIYSIQLLVNSGAPLCAWDGLEVGNKVRIEQGPLRGAMGILTSFRSKQRLIITITLMMRTVSAEVDHDWVSVVSPVPMRMPVQSESKLLALKTTA